jgi:TonB family protein
LKSGVARLPLLHKAKPATYPFPPHRREYEACNLNYHNFLNILGGHLILILVNEELRFDGKPISHFNEWVKEHQVYPRKALKLGLEGRVSVCFTITEEGELADVKVLKGGHKVFDEASVRLIKSSSGKWTPATQSGFT